MIEILKNLKKIIIYKITILPGLKRIWKIYVHAKWYKPMHSYIKKEFDRLYEFQTQNPNVIVQVIHDNRVSPPTFGNYLETLFLARYLSISGMTVEYILINQKTLPNEWKKRGMSQNDSDNYFTEQLKLTELILPVNVNFNTYTNFDTQKSKDKFVLFEKIVTMDEINAISSIAINYLMKLHEFKYLNNYLLEKLDKERDIFSKEISKYISINFREGLWDSERDSNLNLFLTDINFLSRVYPDHSIVVLSNSVGLAKVKRFLTENMRRDPIMKSITRIIFQPEQGFTTAAKVALGSEFYFQRNGGGLSMIPIFSQTPYLMVMREVGHYENIRTGDCIVPWAKKNQKTLVSYNGIWKSTKHLLNRSNIKIFQEHS